MASRTNVVSHVIFLVCLLILEYVISSRRIIYSITKDISQTYTNDEPSNFTTVTAQNGYNSEEHTVITDDGYILTIFRITKSNKCLGKLKSPPVLLMHGLLCSSDIWLDAGPESSLGYLLSDACYDVWVGNQRGNYYSRRHEHLDPDTDAEFWRFYVDEIGRYDLPATVDYILKYTSTNTMNYIGYSQGAGIFFVMCSERPDICNKIRFSITLGAASRMQRTKSSAFRLLTEGYRYMEDYLYASGMHEAMPKGGVSQRLASKVCKFPSMAFLCEGVLNALDSRHANSISWKTLSTLFDHFPAGTSVHNMAWYGQRVRSSEFRKFDYGVSGNLNMYGSEVPPAYNLSAMTVPAVMIYGEQDYLVDAQDVKWLVNQLPKVIDVIKVNDSRWNHMDFVYSQHTRTQVFVLIDKFLLQFGDDDR